MSDLSRTRLIERFNFTAADIAVVDDLAFIGVVGGLGILDVSDPADIRLVDQVPLSRFTGSIGSGRRLVVGVG